MGGIDAVASKTVAEGCSNLKLHFLRQDGEDLRGAGSLQSGSSQVRPEFALQWRQSFEQVRMDGCCFVPLAFGDATCCCVMPVF